MTPALMDTAPRPGRTVPRSSLEETFQHILASDPLGGKAQSDDVDKIK